MVTEGKGQRRAGLAPGSPFFLACDAQAAMPTPVPFFRGEKGFIKIWKKTKSYIPQCLIQNTCFLWLFVHIKMKELLGFQGCLQVL